MSVRRQFLMSGEDTQYLDANHPGWETLISDMNKVLLLHNFSVPPGYTVATCTAAIMIPTNYPAEQLDMVYFSPDIKRLDGQAIRQTDSRQHIDGMSYQRWSRHYTPQNPWKSDEDSIATHVMAIRDWLYRALEGSAVA